MTRPRVRSLAISLAALAFLAGPAWSARVVQVRIGNHPTFTRVVFELDGKAGYKIEWSDDGQELVVTLDAASKSRKLSSRSPMVAGVEVEPSGDDSVARVRVRRGEPGVKETILTSPPRIVLDFMLPEDLVGAAMAPKKQRATTAKTPAAAPRTSAGSATPGTPVVAKNDRPEPSRPEPETVKHAAKPGAKTGPGGEPEAAPEPAAPVAKATPPRAPAAKATPPAPVAKATPPRAEPAPPPEVEPTPADPRPVAAPPAPTPRAGQADPLQDGRIVEPKPPSGGAEIETAAPGNPTERGTEPAQPARPEPLPPVAKPGEGAPAKPLAKAPAPTAPAASIPGSLSRFARSLKGSNPLLTFALVGAGALLFLTVVAMLLRRNSRPSSLDALGNARPPDEAEGIGDAFGNETSPSYGGAGIGPAGRDSFLASGPGLFEDDSEKGDMDMAAQLPIERERARMSPSPAGADSDLGPLVRELERRMGQLESRLDQVNEARERLERQVTAQSEELRVQRAAIARTQRALRGMNRGEEQATEPALRDPSKPPPGRA